MSCLKNRQLLKKQAKVLADNLADSTFWGLADNLADGWRIKRQISGNPVTMRVPAWSPLADRLADSWRGIIRQSATPFRVADDGGCWAWPMTCLWITLSGLGCRNYHNDVATEWLFGKVA